MAYDRVNWKDFPDTTTPVNAENLNKMDAAIKSLDNKAGFVGTTAEVQAAITSGAITSGMIVTITDDNAGVPTDAEHITYDNTVSSIQATNVQDALDGLNESLANFDVSGSTVPSGTSINEFCAMVAKKLFATIKSYAVGGSWYGGQGITMASPLDTTPVGFLIMVDNESKTNTKYLTNKYDGEYTNNSYESNDGVTWEFWHSNVTTSGNTITVNSAWTSTTTYYYSGVVYYTEN